MAEQVGPQLEGNIAIDLKDFRKSISEIVDSAKTISSAFESIAGSVTGLQRQLSDTAKNYTATGKAAKLAGDLQSSASQRVADLEDRKANAIARAANRIYTMEQSVRQSNATQSQQDAVISRLRSSLQSYSEAVRNGSMSAIEMDNANTRLGTSLGAARRQLTEYAKTEQQNERQRVASIRSLSEAQVSYNRTRSAIERSRMSTDQKAAAIGKLNQSLMEVQANIRNYGTGTEQAATAQARFRESVAQANVQVRNVNSSFREKQMQSWRVQMMDLTSSVQLALGPLSGVASRIQALTALINRNVLSVAALFAGITALTVSFSKAFSAGTEAERQFLSLEGIVAGLGDEAKFTAQELYDLGTSVGDALLMSHEEGRKAAGMFATLGVISKTQMTEAITAAQGLAQVMGGSLEQNVRRLARLLEDPEKNFDSLRRMNVNFDEATKETILSLRAQGRILEANQVILNRFGFAVKAAEDSTKGVAGALDTATGYMSRFFEQMFTGSTASEQAANQIGRFGDTVYGLIEDGTAERLGEVFSSTISAIGAAVNFLTKHVKVLSTLIAAALVTSLMSAVGALVRKTGVTKIATVALFRYSEGIRNAARSVRRFTAANILMSTVMRATPWGMVISTLGLVATWWFMSGDEAEISAEKSANAAKKIREEISSLRMLSEGEKSIFEDQVSISEEVKKQTRNSIKEIQDEITKAQGEIRAKTSSAAMMGGPMTISQAAEISSLRVVVADLTKELKGLEEAYKGLEEGQKTALDTARELNEQYASQGVNPKAVAESVRALREEYLKDEVALENLIKKRKEVVTQLGVLKKASDEEVKDRKEAIRIGEDVIDALDKEIKKKRESMEENKKQSRSYLALINNLEKLKNELTLVSSGLEGLAFDRLKEQMDIEDTLRGQISVLERLSSEDYPAVAKAMGLVIKEGSSEKEIREQITKAYLDDVRAKHESINAYNRLNAASKAARSVIAGESSEVGRLRKTYKDQVNELNPLFSGTVEERQMAADAMEIINKRMIADFERMNQRASELTRFTPFSAIEQLENDYERRKETLERMYGEEQHMLDQHLANLDESMKKQRMFVQFTDGAEKASEVFSNAMNAMQASGRENTRAYQKIAIAQATMAKGAAIAKAWNEGGPFMGKALAASIALTLGAEIRAISAQRFARGGEVKGPGTSTSDSVPAFLSAGEFVMRASAVRKFGVATLRKMNEGEIPRLNKGGPIFPIGVNSGSRGGSNIQVNIHNNSSMGNGGVNFREEYSTDAEGRDQLDIYIEDVVKESTLRGRMDSVQREAFGNRRQSIRR